MKRSSPDGAGEKHSVPLPAVKNPIMNPLAVALPGWAFAPEEDGGIVEAPVTRIHRSASGCGALHLHSERPRLNSPNTSPIIAHRQRRIENAPIAKLPAPAV